jgi:hypothetical protein
VLARHRKPRNASRVQTFIECSKVFWANPDVIIPMIQKDPSDRLPRDKDHHLVDLGWEEATPAFFVEGGITKFLLKDRT